MEGSCLSPSPRRLGSCYRSRMAISNPGRGDIELTCGRYRNLDAITTTLATALIHYQSPRHHEEAKNFFDAVLKRNSSNSYALVGLGLILEEQQDYEGAMKLLTKALELNAGSTKILSEASWCHVLMGDYAKGKEGLDECLELITGFDAQSRELKAQVLWRMGTCIWNADGMSPGANVVEAILLKIWQRSREVTAGEHILTLCGLCKATETMHLHIQVWEYTMPIL